MDCGSLKQDVVWEDIGAKTLFIIIIFFVLDKNFVDQLAALC